MDFTISAAQQLVVVTPREPSKLPETLARCASFAAQPDFARGFSLLFDARALRRFAGPNQRRLLATAARTLQAAGMNRVAIVVGNDRTFNIAKTACEIAHDAGLEMGAFRSTIAALYWIDFPRAQALPGATDELPPAVLAEIGSSDELEELTRLRRAS
jgi:hypothetical protein